MRVYIILLLLIIYAILSIPFTIIALILGKINVPLQHKFGRLLTYIPTIIFFALNGVKAEVTGLENIQNNNSTGLLFVGNHRSLLDIPLLIKYVPFRIAFIAKSELKKVPFFNWWMMSLGCLFLDRKNIRKGFKTIMKGIQMLKSGESLVIFPEGGRSKTGGFLPFKQGSLKLASKSGAPVIPFTIKGTEEVFEKHGFKIVPNKVWLSFGKPIYLEKLDAETQKSSAAYVQSIVEKMYSEMI